MKKNIEMINAEAPLLEWAVSTLQQASDKPSGADDLIHGMEGVLEGSCSSLMIEQGGAQSQSIDDRKICCGGLMIQGNREACENCSYQSRYGAG